MTHADIAEKERIADRFRSAATRDELVRVAGEESDAKEALAARSGCAVFKIILENLVKYRQAAIAAENKGTPYET